MKKGDIVELEYDAYIKGSDELFDTTHEELAKENEIFQENVDYLPIPVIIGQDRMLVKGLVDALEKAAVGKKAEVEISPEEGFGARNQKLVELHSKREILRLPEFSKGDAFPYVGMQIMFKNRPAIISSVTAGRIRLDFNHRFAGKTLLYKYKVTKKITGLDKEVGAILRMHYPSKDEFTVKAEKKKKSVDITLPDICKYDNKWTLAKYGIIGDLREVTKMETIRFVEEYVKIEPKEEKDTKKDDKKGKDSKKDVKEESKEEVSKEEVPKEEKKEEEKKK